MVDIERQRNKFLAIDDPVAGKNQQERHEFGIAEHLDEIAQRLGDARGISLSGAPRFLEEHEHDEKHQKNAQRRHAEHDGSWQVFVDQSGEPGSERAADVRQSVVEGVPDGADILLGGPRGRANNARLHQRDPQGRQNQKNRRENSQRQKASYRREPRRSDRTKQEVRACEDQVGEGESTSKAEPAGDGSPEDSQEPYQAAKEPGQTRGALRREVEDFVKVADQRSEHVVVGETLEEFGDIGDPEGALEAGSYLVETLAETHFSPG